MIARALAACLVSTSRAAGAVPASPLDMDMRPIWRARRRRAASLTAWPRHSAASPARPAVATAARASAPRCQPSNLPLATAPRLKSTIILY